MINKKEYKVIWFDDEYETLEEINESAKDNNIKLFPFDNENQGVENLKLNKGFYDAILTDAIFHTDSSKNDDLEGKDADNALLNLLRSIDRLKDSDPLPVFILSGKTSFKNNDQNLGIKFGVEIFDKLDNENRNLMWASIKNEIDKQPIQKLKLKYSRVFRITEEKYLGTKSFGTIFDLVSLLEKEDEYSQSKDDFIKIRKITEIIIDKLYDLNLIPIDLKGNYNKIIRFICSEQSDFLHPTLSFVFRNMNDLLQDSSHSKDELMYKVDEYSIGVKSPFILKSLIYQMFDVIIWLKDYIDKFPFRDENFNNLKPYVDYLIKGKATYNSKGYLIFKPNYGNYNATINKDLVDKYKLENEDEISVEIGQFVKNNITKHSK